MKERVTIKIPEDLYENLKKMIEKTGFSSVNEFIVYTMRNIASGGHITENNLTKKEIQAVRKRLKALGYI